MSINFDKYVIACPSEAETMGRLPDKFFFWGAYTINDIDQAVGVGIAWGLIMWLRFLLGKFCGCAGSIPSRFPRRIIDTGRSDFASRGARENKAKIICAMIA